MAENKKSFILYCDLIHTIEKMPSDKAGELFKHILEYVNDMNPETDDLIIQLTFEPIKQQLKRDLKKFEETKKDKSIGGRMGNLKRWNPDLFDKVVIKELTLEQAETIAQTRIASHTDNIQSHSIAKIAVNDNVNVNVNDTVNVNENKKRVKAFSPPTLLEVQNYFFENGYTKESGLKAFNYYNTAQWKDSTGKQVKNWKQKMIAVWFKDENKIIKQQTQKVWQSPA
jgi:hypothetical protein